MEKATRDSDLPVELCSPFSEPDLAGALGEDRVHYPSLFGSNIVYGVLVYGVLVYFYAAKV